jgi:4-hydroxybenzoate polyprenyltransferase
LNPVTAFFRLVRYPNLVFIALTQVLFFYCIEQPVFKEAHLSSNINGFYLILLIITSIFIAAAGNIINDYFDLNIDQINKPTKVIVGKIINRRWTIIWHLILSIAGIAIGFYIDFKTNARFIGAVNLCCVLLLFFYSVSLKKKFLIGNILVSLLTAWTILILIWCENNLLNPLTPHISLPRRESDKLILITFMFSGFAFIISLIREVVKDMEDIEGDRKYGCKTLPIIWGINASKVFVAVWLIVLIAAIAFIQFYTIRFGWWQNVVYSILFILLPLLWVFKKLFSATTAKDFHMLSSIIKGIMFTGILSMIFFKFFNY